MRKNTEFAHLIYYIPVFPPWQYFFRNFLYLPVLPQNFREREPRFSGSECPSAVAENGNDPAVFCVGVNGNASAEPIMKSSWIMESLTPMARHSASVLLLVIADGIGKAHPQSQMAGGIFIKKGVIKTADRSGGSASHRALGHIRPDTPRLRPCRPASAAAPHFSPHAARRPFAAGKPKPEALDQLPLVGQRHRGMDNPLCFAALGGDKALLGGDICIEENALAIRIAAAPLN